MFWHPKCRIIIRLSCFALCINEMDNWMSANQLKLNTEKMQFIWFGTKLQLMEGNCKSVSLNEVDIQPSMDVTCLGVFFDSEVDLAKHLTFVRIMVYHLQ